MNAKRTLLRILKAMWETIKKCGMILINYPEALLILLLATVGLTFLISQIPQVVQVPVFMEGPGIAPALASLIMTGIIFLMNRRPNVS